MYRSSYLTLALLFISVLSYGQELIEFIRYNVPEAKQAVAVDRDHFYVINNSIITKHKKQNGELVVKWDGTDVGIPHLNSGVVIKKWNKQE